MHPWHAWFLCYGRECIWACHLQPNLLLGCHASRALPAMGLLRPELTAATTTQRTKIWEITWLKLEQMNKYDVQTDWGLRAWKLNPTCKPSHGSRFEEPQTKPEDEHQWKIKIRIKFAGNHKLSFSRLTWYIEVGSKPIASYSITAPWNRTWRAEAGWLAQRPPQHKEKRRSGKSHG